MNEAYNKPLPKNDPLVATFWEQARKNVLVVQRCASCGDMHFPPTPVCPKCLSTDQGWQPCSGEGTFDSWIEMHRAYWPGFADSLPYPVCIVKLAEGPILVSNLVGDASGAKLGAKVQVVFDKVTDTVTLPKFKLA